MSTDFLDSLDPGTRVVLRYRLSPDEQGQAGERMSDALGYLLTIDEHSVTVQTRTGEVQVSRAAITHAKRVPPPPVHKRAAPGN
ncbi:hypothetical protein DQ353_18970 [Arthrobacter sp. AQ5-05]|uniref:putative acetyltransferase n=1 Tax=Arthrobacter sp. AQ5-05 TaxID=2184581 RepID=UPI000DCDAD41|nr:hypothetical protein [Arthrobacter sp. AQ5-05]RAX47378.1 hypothetical protein DQ353_18970 [Arthrobacter sp. AQ5-05]